MNLGKIRSFLESKISRKTVKDFIIFSFILTIPFVIKFFESSLNNKVEFFNTEEIFILPEQNGEKILLNFLNLAEKSVYINIYLLSDNTIISRLKEMFYKGIDIKIILEKNPFGGGTINYKTNYELSKVGINVSYREDNFKLNHAKYIIIDKKFTLLMTCNLTKAGLNENRDFIIYEDNSKIVNNISKLFENDFNRKEYIPKLGNLIISPYNSRNKITELLNRANSSIKIYGENIEDKDIQNILINKKINKIDIKVIMADVSKIEVNKISYNNLKNNKIEVKSLVRPYQHSKIIVIDNEIAYIGSVNFSQQSMNENREVGIITINPITIQKLNKTFIEDWEN